MMFWPASRSDIADDMDNRTLALALYKTCGLPSVVLDRRGVGSGKTQEALEYVVQLVRVLTDGETIYIFAPTKALCEEILQRLIALDGSLLDKCLVWRGRAASDPHRDDAMCPFHQAADIITMRGGDPEKVLCAAKDQRCKHHDKCGYRKQQANVQGRSIIIQPHAMLPLVLRKGMGKPALLVIDEDPYTALLEEPVKFHIDDIVAPLKVPVPGPKAKPDVDDPTQFLASILRQVHDVLNKAHGIVGTNGLPNAGDVRRCVELLYRIVRSLPCSLKPNPTPKAVETYIDQGALALRVFQLIKLLYAIQRSRNKGQIIGCRMEKRNVTVRPKKYPNDVYASAPTLILSATAQPLILQRWWRQLDASKLEIPDAPNETVVQFRAKATKELLGDGKAMMKKIIAGTNQFSRLFRNTGGEGPDGLVVLQKTPSEQLKKVAPDNVAVANFGAVAGINDYENVGFQMIVGRPLPHPSVVELIAEVIKDDVIDRKDADFFKGWYPKHSVPIELKGGGSVPTKMEYHPDPVAKAVLKVVCEGEVAQANRGRGLRRTEENPLTTIFVNEQVPPFPVDKVYEGFPFGPIDIMVGKGLVLDADARQGHWQIVAAVAPEWFDTPNAARKFFENDAASDVGSIGQTHIEFLYGFGRLRENDHLGVPTPPTVPFDEFTHAKITLHGKRYGVPVFIDHAHGDPEEHATRLLGPLKKFELIKSS
jgi:hypothetical protein